jgi:hypothetical protein
VGTSVDQLKPGVERWAIKTGVDAQATDVVSAVTPVAILDLIGRQAPADPDTVADRDAPVELTTYEVTATLIGYKLEADGDYHLVLDDGQGHTMIAEIPDPAFCAQSLWLAEITASRKAFDGKFGPQIAALKVMMVSLAANEGVPMITKVSVPVVVTGIGFFDRLHGQTGVAPNGIELHPVLDISFG